MSDKYFEQNKDFLSQDFFDPELIEKLSPFWQLMPLAFLKLLLPFPTKVKYHFAEVISYEFLEDNEPKEILKVVESKMQKNLTKLSKQRITPWF